MKLEDQVCSLDLAKRLKELGVKAMRWKAIPGFINYEVSDNGIVRSNRRAGALGGVIKQHPVCGYLQVWLSEKNKVHKLSVHRAVLMAFDRLPVNQEVCNHKDGNKENNSIMNLEWCTRAENEAHKKNVLGEDGKGEKNANFGYRHAKMYPSPTLRNRLCGLGIPRYKHNLAELGEMLPYTICDVRYWIQASKTMTNSHRFSYVTDSHDFHSEYADTEADARAKMLVYLLENKLVKL